VRAAICSGLRVLGVVETPADAGEADIVVSGEAAAVPVLVVHAREDLEIVREVRRLLAAP